MNYTLECGHVWTSWICNNWTACLTAVSSQPSNCCRYRKSIFDCVPMHNYFAVYLLCFLRALYWPSFTSKTPNKNQEVEQLFYCLSVWSYKWETSMSSAVFRFVHAIHERVQKVPRAKSGTFWFPCTEFCVYLLYAL